MMTNRTQTETDRAKEREREREDIELGDDRNIQKRQNSMFPMRQNVNKTHKFDQLVVSK